MLTIRPFDYSAADYAAIAALEAAAMPQYANVPAEWRHLDAVRSPDVVFHREMLRRGETLVAWGDVSHAYWLEARDIYEINLYVHPAHDAPDIRPALYAHMQEVLAPHQPRALITGTFEDHAAQVAFLTAQGFQVMLREVELALDVAAFDPAPFAAVPERVAAAGIRIVPVTEFQTIDPFWKHKLYSLHWVFMRETPAPYPPRQALFESFERAALQSPHFDPAGWFVALDGMQPVGMCRGWLDLATPGKFTNAITGVLRQYRRRGIATALKLRLIAYARQVGAREIVTGCAEGSPMADLNRALGFVLRPAWLHFEHTLRA